MFIKFWEKTLLCYNITYTFLKICSLCKTAQPTKIKQHRVYEKNESGLQHWKSSSVASKKKKKDRNLIKTVTQFYKC